MTTRVLTVGLTYEGEAIEGTEIENLGLCSPAVAQARAAFPLYEYDTIVINPASYSHFIFGKAGEHSDDPYELSALKRNSPSYDIDTVYEEADREREMETALADGANVVWCLSEAKRQNFFGYRETTMGYASPDVARLVARARPRVKKGRRLGDVEPGNPFAAYFESLSRSGWSMCLSAEVAGYRSVASTPEGYSVGGFVDLGRTKGWLVTPPTCAGSAASLVRGAIDLGKSHVPRSRFHDVFLSHTAADKPFVRRLRRDLLAHGLTRVWLDEAEIEIGDSLIAKIDEGLRLCRYVAVVLSPRSIEAPLVKKELEIALHREIAGGEVVVLPLLYERCEPPTFLKGKLYADFSDPAEYDSVLERLLRRLRIR